jgi:hypothetical protein
MVLLVIQKHGLYPISSLNNLMVEILNLSLGIEIGWDSRIGFDLIPGIGLKYKPGF